MKIMALIKISYLWEEGFGFACEKLLLEYMMLKGGFLGFIKVLKKTSEIILFLTIRNLHVK